jgi:hypothetical protein
MKASVKNLIAENPNGLFEMKRSLSIREYRDNYGFGLKNIFTIYESKKSHHSGNDWFAFPSKTVETLFTVQEESEGDILVVFIVETIKEGRVYCHLVLTDEAFRGILNDGTQHILQVHQMYEKFWEDHIAMNCDNSYEEVIQEESGRIALLTSTGNGSWA